MCQPGGLTAPRPLLKWPLQQSCSAARDITPRSFPYAARAAAAGCAGSPPACPQPPRHHRGSPGPAATRPNPAHRRHPHASPLSEGMATSCASPPSQVGKGLDSRGGPQTSPSRSAALLQRGQTKEPGAPGAPAACSAPLRTAGAHRGANAGGTGKGAPRPRLASATELRAACAVLQPPQSLSRKENAPAFGAVLAVCSCPKAARARGASPRHAPGVAHQKPGPC